MVSKTESIVFCHPSFLQIQLGAILLRWVRQEFGIDDERSLEETNCGQQQCESTAQNKTAVRSVLCVITAFRKLCNHPELLRKFIETSSSTVDRLPRQLTLDLLRIFNEPDVVRLKEYMDDPSLYSSLIECSGKLAVLNHMLRQLFQPATAQSKSYGSMTKHRLVLVSNFTQTLDLLQPICSRITGQSCLRLDGQTSAKRRWDLVQRFNASDSSERILLLSSRAGGMGLNLTGADHLILYDVDWNPANDAQALARVWRPGQSRPVRLYRLITADSLEERMFQRQAAKTALSFNAVVSPFDNDCDSCIPSFKPLGILTKEELRDLFQMPPCSVPSWTHHLIGCTCDSGMVTLRPSLSTDILKSDPTDDHNSESDTRNFQLGASTFTHSAQNCKPMSESLAFLLDWTHSLNYAAILQLKDPLLSPLSDNTPPINAVFSLTTNGLDPPSSVMYS
ncbi:DNA repair and recombination protein RAD54B [Paragonimus heterotremus]|uniref:DNA repair and recombination protein RAD54B n=1 Tax=Paragonimus heterotremus TaxID=100268 RepID=A0A8J4SK88_9TREM|nr:DNA repair and recombination protein RAD54B [Paragonimus heterotremus]